jgi:hypothetical protein
MAHPRAMPRPKSDKDSQVTLTLPGAWLDEAQHVAEAPATAARSSARRTATAAASRTAWRARRRPTAARSSARRTATAAASRRKTRGARATPIAAAAAATPNRARVSKPRGQCHPLARQALTSGGAKGPNTSLSMWLWLRQNRTPANDSPFRIPKDEAQILTGDTSLLGLRP